MQHHFQGLFERSFTRCPAWCMDSLVNGEPVVEPQHDSCKVCRKNLRRFVSGPHAPAQRELPLAVGRRSSGLIRGGTQSDGHYATYHALAARHTGDCRVIAPALHCTLVQAATSSPALARFSCSISSDVSKSPSVP